MSKKILDIFFGMFVYLAVCDLMHFQAWNSNTYWKVYCGTNKISAKYFQQYCPAHCCWFCSEQYSNVEGSVLKICLSNNILCNRFKKKYQIFFKKLGLACADPVARIPIVVNRNVSSLKIEKNHLGDIKVFQSRNQMDDIIKWKYQKFQLSLSNAKADPSIASARLLLCFNSSLKLVLTVHTEWTDN